MEPSDPPTALTKRDASTALMPPLSKRIKRPAKVLDEDSYTDALSHIIARDFFPGLLESHTQHEYLDAVESKDKEWIKEAGRKLTEVMTPGPQGRRLRGKRGVSMTPVWDGRGEVKGTPGNFGGGTPASIVEGSEAGHGPAQTEVEKSMSLSAFQAKYTSEDNESFNALLDKQNAKKRENNAWVWNQNRLPSARQIAQKASNARLIEASSAGDDASAALILRRNRDTRKAMPEFKPSDARNTLMFSPEGIEDTHETLAQVAENASMIPPKLVRYDNTRLPGPTSGNSRDTIIPPSPSMSAVDAAIAGRPRGTDTDPGYTGSETPRVNGYAFVDAEPEPGEGIGGNSRDGDSESDSEVDPAMLLSRLGAPDMTPNPFHLRAASKREELHHRLVDKVAKHKRAAGTNRLAELKGGSATPKFKSSPVVKGNLTPAAQKLFDKVGTPKNDGLNGVFGGVGGKSTRKERTWTPLTTPKIKR